MNIELRVVWVSPEENPADAPSRNAPLPSRAERPPWSQQLWTQVPPQEERRERRADKVKGVDAVDQAGVRGRKVRGSRLGTRYLPSQVDDVGDACCREFYAGTGHLSAGLRRQGLSTIEYELFRGGEADPLADMTADSVIDRQIADAKRGLIHYAHVGIVCSSWGIINRIWNHGTRTPTAPYGNGTLAR